MLGVGHYLPSRVLSNEDLENIVETSDEWIVTRTGIKQRRQVDPGQACSDLAFEASKRALEQAGLDPKDLTHILLATFTPDYCTPTTACVLQGKLGASQVMLGADLAAGCSGFLYGLDLARGTCRMYPKARILVVGSEVCTSRVNFTDRNTCVLFGDGAGAAVVAPGLGSGPVVLDTLLKTDGSLGHLLPVGQEGGSKRPYKLGQSVTADYFIQMKGRELFRHAVRGMAEMAENILQKNGLQKDDVAWVIPHQANLRIIEGLAKKMDYPLDQVFINVDQYGNTSAASVIIALSEAMSSGKIRPGQKVLLVTFGAGLTWGAALLQF